MKVGFHLIYSIFAACVCEEFESERFVCLLEHLLRQTTHIHTNIRTYIYTDANMRVFLSCLCFVYAKHTRYFQREGKRGIERDKEEKYIHRQTKVKHTATFVAHTLWWIVFGNGA